MPVLYIDIDSLRPDHVGCYGYEQPTTPNIDELAADSVRFDRAYVASSPCMSSRAAFVSGRYGINNGLVTHGPPGQTLNSPATRRDHLWTGYDDVDEAYWTLPELFFKNRIRTAAVSSFPRHPAPWFYHLWHEFHQPQEPEGGYFQTPRAEDIADIGIDALDRTSGEEFFMYLQFWEPHDPYLRSPEEVEPFRDAPLPPYPTAEMLEKHMDWDAFRSPTDSGLDRSLTHCEYDHIENMEALREVIAGYDAEIHYADRHVGRVLDALRERGLYDETLIVVTADHGEEFGEHGLYREHWSTHEGTQNVPLLVKPPASADVDPGSREELVTNVDMAPTLADYAGLEPPASWQGRSIRPLLEAENDADWREFVVLDHGQYTAQRAIRTDQYKYIRTYNPGMWGGVVPEEALYDLDADPWEQENIASERPEVAEDLRKRMAAWAEAHIGPEEDPLHAAAREGPEGMHRLYLQDGYDYWEGV
jgi:arylsulfatase A-like enzyme